MTKLTPEPSAGQAPPEEGAAPEVALPEDLAEEVRTLELRLGRAATGAANQARIGLFALRLPHGADYDRVSDTALAWRANERFPAASTIKIYVLQALLEGVAAGALALDDERQVTAADQVSGSGILKAMTPGRHHSLLDLATLMIVISDNTATNVLIDAVGLDAINAVIAKHGWRGTRLGGKLQLPPQPGSQQRLPSMTTPSDLADCLGRLWLGQLLPPELTEVAKSIYRQQQVGELGRALDYDSYSAEIGVAPWRIASKSGSIRGVRNDVGVFEPQQGGQRYVIAVMTRGCPDERFHAENLGAKVVGQVSAAVHARLAG